MSLTNMLFNFYRAAVPVAIRKGRLMSRLRRFKPKIGHNAIYDAGYFASTIEISASASAGPMANSILFEFQPRNVVDVGCGTGVMLEVLQRAGCRVFGLEYSEEALRYCRRRNLEVRKFDLENDSLTDAGTYDVAISMEVAEHLPERVADRYVNLLTRLSDRIVFTAAHPGQGGVDHVNEQPKAYWIAKFQARGFAHDGELSQGWGRNWEETGIVSPWYFQNLMVFRRSSD